MHEFVDIVAVIAIVAYVLGRQLTGEPLRGKRVILLPVILAVIGFADLSGNKAPVRPVDVVLLIAGVVASGGFGLALGSIMKLESRDGSLWGKLPVAGLWLWLGLLVSRLMLTLVAHGLNAKVAGASSTILLMLGINRLAQAAVIVARAGSAGIPFAPEKDGSRFLARLTDRSSMSSSNSTQRSASSSPSNWSQAPAPARTERDDEYAEQHRYAPQNRYEQQDSYDQRARYEQNDQDADRRDRHDERYDRHDRREERRDRIRQRRHDRHDRLFGRNDDNRNSDDRNTDGGYTRDDDRGPHDGPRDDQDQQGTWMAAPTQWPSERDLPQGVNWAAPRPRNTQHRENGRRDG